MGEFAWVANIDTGNDSGSIGVGLDYSFFVSGKLESSVAFFRKESHEQKRMEKIPEIFFTLIN